MGTGCPDDNEITALFEGTLSDEAVARVDAHASTCALCRGLLVEFVREPRAAVALSAGSAPTLLETGFVDDALRARAQERDARIGQVLGENWTLVRLIGAGGMARVYEARHRNGRRVAVKILRQDLGDAPSHAARFLQEGLAANRIDHPAIVAALDDGTTEDGAHYLVMELLEGETLKARVAREGPLGEGEVLRLTDTLLDALAAAHARGVLHRDLKPDNLFLTRAGDLKVLDFGIARITGQEQHATQPGSSMGTPAFMPPEQARGRWELVDARSDLWAVGATMYALLSGRPPRGGGTTNEDLLLAMTAPVPSLATARAGAAAVVTALVDRALALEPSARFADAAAMQAAVRNALADVEAGRAKPHAAARAWPKLLGTLAAGAIVVGLVALVGARRGEAPPGAAAPKEDLAASARAQKKRAEVADAASQARCEDYAAPGVTALCHPPGGNQANGCYGGYHCLTTIVRCVPPPVGCP
jgi:Protein kinase domain